MRSLDLSCGIYVCLCYFFHAEKGCVALSFYKICLCYNFVTIIIWFSGQNCGAVICVIWCGLSGFDGIKCLLIFPQKKLAGG